jgi:hypothetical protein
MEAQDNRGKTAGSFRGDAAGPKGRIDPVTDLEFFGFGHDVREESAITTQAFLFAHYHSKL